MTSRTRRITRGYAASLRSARGPKKCTESVAPPSELPTDIRRSDCRSEGLQPRRSVLGAIGKLAGDFTARQPMSERDSSANCDIHVYDATRGRRRPDQGVDSPRKLRSTQKCTESVSPPSGLPTDLRRSDCRSEGHQPQALRARCNRHSRASPEAPSRHRRDRTQITQFAIFSLRTAHTCADAPCALERTGPGIRRAGCAFVHTPG